MDKRRKTLVDFPINGEPHRFLVDEDWNFKCLFPKGFCWSRVHPKVEAALFEYAKLALPEFDGSRYADERMVELLEIGETYNGR